MMICVVADVTAYTISVCEQWSVFSFSVYLDFITLDI